MEIVKIKELVTFVQGINPTRAKKKYGDKELNYYDQSSFDSDYNHEDVINEEKSNSFSIDELTLNEGDVVISNSLQIGAIVGRGNAGKILSINFTKLDFETEKLDKKYFLFLFNADKGVRRQKEREMQGTGPILRIPLRSLGELSIPILPIEEQQQIGDIYTEMLQLQNKLCKYGEILEQFTGMIIEEKLRR